MATIGPSARRACLATVSVALACIDPFAPPEGTYRYDPPANYAAAWRSVEACSGLRGDLGRVRWHAVPEAFPCPPGRCAGAWEPPHNAYIAEPWVYDSVGGYFTVRHEMLHDLVGTLSHPPVFERCGLVRR